jgi:predicted dehydrogenase
VQELRLAIIGCGKPRNTTGATGFGMSHAHMKGYTRCEGVKLAAVADIVRSNGEAFVKEYGSGKVYEDYKQMLHEEHPDVVSIATWPKLHHDMVLAACDAKPKAIHCEKPIALTFGEAKRMVDAAKKNNVQLTFNHQRRFTLPIMRAKEILKSGAIGKLTRIETSCPNLYDWGTHWFDIICFFNDEADAKWVIGQIDPRDTRYIFDAPCEGQGLAHIKFQNGVHAIMVSGYEHEWEADIRLLGTDGVIEVVPKDRSYEHLRVWGKGDSHWKKIEVAESIHDNEAVARGVVDLIDALRNKRTPQLSSDHAFRSTELIFATYESSRKRGRVDLPLAIDDNPLIEMLPPRK